jgi:hypothetical protein
VRKELSPFTSGDHVIYDFSTELFVFGDRIGAIEDAVFYIVCIDTTQTILRFFHLKTIKDIISLTNNT